MIDALFSQPNYLAAKKMLDVTALRQEAIASNLANLETPNYKRIDVSPAFENQLQQAIAGQEPETIAGLQPELEVDPTAVASRTDGNTVQLEDELLKLNQNTVNNVLQTQLVTDSLYKLRMAITGKS
jgi:flagellar basal-body rod protein FlgB